MDMAKRRVNMWLDGDVADAVEQEAKRSQQTMTELTGQLLREALASREHDQQPQIVKLLHAVIHEELKWQSADLPVLIAAAVQQADQVRYHDITTLLIRAIHQAGLAWRLNYVALSLNVPEDHLKQIFADAEQRVLEQLQYLDIKGAEG